MRALADVSWLLPLCYGGHEHHEPARRWLESLSKGGEVVGTSPEKTACFVCATITRHSITTSAGQVVDPEVDYGTGRLVGEVALGVDIQHVSSAALATDGGISEMRCASKGEGIM